MLNQGKPDLPDQETICSRNRLPPIPGATNQVRRPTSSDEGLCCRQSMPKASFRSCRTKAMSKPLIFPPDFSFLRQQAPETPAEPNPSRAYGASRVTHCDVIHRLCPGNGCPEERAFGQHPIFAAQQLAAIVGCPPLHEKVLRRSHYASLEPVYPPCRETQDRRPPPCIGFARDFPGSLLPGSDRLTG
jgi:hypothetical protein